LEKIHYKTEEIVHCVIDWFASKTYRYTLKKYVGLYKILNIFKNVDLLLIEAVLQVQCCLSSWKTHLAFTEY